jgi:putative flippase GtrA
MALDFAGIVRAFPRMKIFGFGLFSIVGLGGDYLLFTAFILAGLAPFPANLISAGTAVLFVFVVSVRHVFEDSPGNLFVKLALYVAYQIVAVALFSWAIAAVSEATNFFPLFVKIASTPFSFYLNFLFMGFVAERRLNLL